MAALMLALCLCANACLPAAEAAGLLYYTPSTAHTVAFNQRSAIIDGTPTLMLSGAVHYTRVHEEEWERVFLLAREMGLNTIQTYVFWNAHETNRSQVGAGDWTGRKNLPRFIQLAAKHSLWVTVRIGPYICGEYYFGGIPVWMRESGAECFRCADTIWEKETQRWVAEVVNKISSSLATAGGNVVMLQIENEYNGDQVYLQEQVDMARKITTAVPWNLCHDVGPCTTVNTNSNGKYEYKALCTINGFWMDEYQTDTRQPCPAWIRDLQTGNPGQPLIWTEDQGWFDQWGVAQRVRDPRDQLYGIARFVAHGGSWHNFYMLTGGNNYGKQSGGEVVTAYAPDTVIDYLLLRHAPRFDYYSRFFHVLANISDALLHNPIPTAKALPAKPVAGGNVTSAAWGLNLGHCTDDDPSHPGALDSSQQFTMEGSAAAGTGSFAFQSVAAQLCLEPFAAHPQDPEAKSSALLVPCSRAGKWTYDAETQRLRSVAQHACVAPPNRGKQCHVCLDVKSSGGGIDLWDCKLRKPSGGGEDNQAFQWVAKEQGLKHGGLCLTVAKSANGAGAELAEYGAVSFLSNMGDADVLVTMPNGGAEMFMLNHSVYIVDSSTNTVLFNSSDLNGPATGRATESAEHVIAATRTTEWHAYAETPGSASSVASSVDGPVEQLHFTDGFSTDYMWYETTVAAAERYSVKVRGAGSGTILYAYVDGILIGNTSSRPRSLKDGELFVADGAGRHAPAPRTATLQLLSVAMGLSNGGVGPNSRKGLYATGPLSNGSACMVRVNGVDVTTRPWQMKWLMSGETKKIYSPESTGAVTWQPASAVPETASLVWFKALFDLPAGSSASVPNSTATAEPPAQLSYALSMVGANKGVAYVNGFELGRYWLEVGECKGQCAPPIKNGHCYMHWKGCGEPTQTLYHVPTPVLKPQGNLVVIFEETASVVAQRDLEMVKLVELHAHPA